MKRLIVCLMLVMPSICSAGVIGRFTPLKDLGVQSAIVRNAAEGMYDYGAGVEVWNASLVCKQDHWYCTAGVERKFWTFGGAQAWNPDQGKPYSAIFTGPRIIDLNLNPGLDLATQILGLSNAWKPSQYLSMSTSVDVFVGYRPGIGGDIKHAMPWGFLFLLNGKFTPSDVFGIIQKGL